MLGKVAVIVAIQVIRIIHITSHPFGSTCVTLSNLGVVSVNRFSIDIDVDFIRFMIREQSG
jgi:hypothetical protein